MTTSDEPAAPLSGAAGTGQRGHRSGTARTVVTAVAAFLCVFLVRSAVAETYYIPTESMLPTLAAGDRVLALKFGEPRTGDIVVFAAPEQPPGTLFIKRVVAVGGKRVEGRSGGIIVDGEWLDEPYLPSDVRTTEFPAADVDEGCVWVLGDNRADSSDSRVFGQVCSDQVVGRAVARVWPPGRVGSL